MTREEAFDLLGPYVDGDLPEETRHRIETILFSDRDLAWEAQTLTVTRARLREGIGEVVASDSFRARTLALLYAENQHVSPTESAAENSAQYQLPIRL